jgi:uncharacterized membrane protein
MAEYTIQDYIIYLGILLVILWATTKYVFERIQFDRRFLLAASPYIVFGVTLRMLVDVGVFERNPLWNITPGVYIVTVALCLVGVSLGLSLQSLIKVEYWYIPLIIGISSASYTSYKLILHIESGSRIIYPFALAAFLTIIIYYLSPLYRPARIFRNSDNTAIIFAHLLDGAATFIGIDFYHFSEEHLLPDFLIKFTGTAFVMIPVKIAVVLSALYLLERWYTEEKLKGTPQFRQQYYTLKFVFFILGIGPGLRDAILPSTI